MQLVQTCNTALDCFVKEQVNSVSLEAVIVLIVVLVGILMVRRGLRLFKK